MGETGIVGALKAPVRRFVHLLARNARPGQRVSVADRELADEFALRASIAIAKRMDGVEFAHTVGGPIRETRDVKAGEVSLLAELAQSIAERGENLLGEGEVELAGARDVDRPEFSGPRVHILKNMAVDGLKVRDVERAGVGLG